MMFWEEPISTAHHKVLILRPIPNSSTAIRPRFRNILVRPLLLCHPWTLLLIRHDETGDVFWFGGGTAPDLVFVFSGGEVLSCVASGGPLVEQIRLGVLFEVRFCDHVCILLVPML